MADFRELLNFVKDEGISENDAERVLDGLSTQALEDMVIPESLSVENTLIEINGLTRRLYELHNKNKRDPIIFNKLIALLELKTKIQGMLSVKPDVQAMIDSEINTYKRRFLELAKLAMDKPTLETLCEKLTREGL